ncbi:MAG: S8 family serine peptidase [Pseudomonadota bacterium]
MAGLKFYSHGKLQSFRASTLGALAKRAFASRGRRGRGAGAAVAAPKVLKALARQKSRLASRFNEFNEETVRLMPTEAQAEHGMASAIIPTETVIIEGAGTSELKWLRENHGLNVIHEGRSGKLLLRASEGGDEGLKRVFAASTECFERGNVAAVHPNFLRMVSHPNPSAADRTVQPWHVDNDGSTGVVGADVHARAAWTISRGDPGIRIAVLDEGVDSRHPQLRRSVVAEYDAVDENPTSRPDGDDAHGTACAGIICSSALRYPGLASKCSLVGVRIAKSDNEGHWIFDDFSTADAIDWSWEEAKADVLSNSWGGGPAVDVITNAFERARTQGRDGKGSVLVIAAGNNQGPVAYPGSLPDVLTVGASNQWDERKTKTSDDNETWWGSNFGAALDLMAPGVKISTTDISGSSGYSTTQFTDTFNGTSSATPMVAACAGLILSVRPDLQETQVRKLITDTADHLTQTGKWNKFVGHGRLNCYAALRAAKQMQA